ncbi:voltage-gated hydrogen channel 1-like isoform X2 [Acanthaster planci]|nr:voltage-gated hydrogen channel 1-like isoform X2 [Acanthaster planci]
MGLKFSKAEDERDIVVEDREGDIDEPHHHDDHENSKGPQTCREKLREFLHTQKMQITIIVLVVLDCVFVIGELVLDLEDAALGSSCTTKAPPMDGNVTYDQGEMTRHKRAAEEYSGEHSPLKQAKEALHYLSIVILSLFMIELMLKLIALGSKFFHSKLEIFDAFVIVVSFILDIVTLVLPDSFAIIDLVVVLRLWRIMRIVNGVILSVEQRAEKRIHHHKRVRERAVQAAMKFEEYGVALEEEIQKLRELLNTNGIKIDEECIKKRPEKPHYDQKYHNTSENGDGKHHHHHHHHLPFLGHKKHAHPKTQDSNTEDVQPDTSDPPHYDTLHHGNHEARC